MTNFEALQSFPEFENLSDNLLSKALLDAAITESTVYAKTSEQSLDICAAGIYLLMSAMPQYKEGTQSEKWDIKACLAARDSLYRKWGKVPPESVTTPMSIDGKARR